MKPPKPPNTHQRGPRLVDYALWLIREHGLGNKEVHERYGVGAFWLSGVETGQVKSPACDTIQKIVEDLSGAKLVPEQEKAPPHQGAIVAGHNAA